MGKRRKGREIVLQASYASMISGADLEDSLKDQLSRRESADETSEFAEDLMKKIRSHRTDLEKRRNDLLKSSNWKPERLGVLEKVILLMGLAELVHSPDVPVKVVINEALELTRRYCDEKAVGFVNGVLDNAANQIYPQGIPDGKPAVTDGGSS